jgi:radical SAM superfamily enzyme YgiQ (UPF0313 family)
MKITFLIPPVLPAGSQRPAERTAGCTTMVYPMVNIYELTMAALLERDRHAVSYEDFVNTKRNARQFNEFIEKDDSDVYVFWTVNLAIRTDLLATQIVNQLNADAYVVYLGPAATYYPTLFLTNQKQIIVRGEPEIPMQELCAYLAENQSFNDVNGISYLDPISKKIKHNPFREPLHNLDSLPFPARHFVDKNFFRNPKLKRSPYTAVVTSRNCPFQCTYCVPSSLTFARELEHKANVGKKPFISQRSPENVVKEIEALAKEGYKAIGFMDDEFILNEKRLKTIASALKEHKIVWGCQTRADSISENIAKILKESNCKYVDIGVESFNDEILKDVRKNLTCKQIFDAVNLLHQYRVPVKLNILVGASPLETEETLKNTMGTALKLKVDQVMINLVAPFPGTDFYETAKKNNWIVGGEYVPTDVQHHSILSYPHLPNTTMEQLLNTYNRKFFLRPSYILKQLLKFSSPVELWKSFIAVKNKLTNNL